MSTRDVDGASLYYETHGSGPLIVIVAGATGTGASFTSLAEHLADNATVLTYDRRGFSRSPLHGRQAPAGSTATPTTCTPSSTTSTLRVHEYSGPAPVRSSRCTP